MKNNSNNNGSKPSQEVINDSHFNIEEESGNPFDLTSKIIENTNNIIHKKSDSSTIIFEDSIEESEYSNENLIEMTPTNPYSESDDDYSDNEEDKNLQQYLESNKPIKKSDVKIINSEIQDQSDNPFENEAHVKKSSKRKM